MAMPTEEKRVVKKVVVQPDGTKKVIKKIIKKVPKKDGITAAVPAAEETPVSTGENLESKNSVNLDDVSDLFGTQENQNNPTQENNNQPENQLNDSPVQESQDTQTTTQPENQEAGNTIDLGSFDFSQGDQAVSQDTPAQQENVVSQENAGAATLDMDSLLGETPAPENSSVESVTPENQVTTENTSTLDLNQMISQPEQTADQNQQAVPTGEAENTEDNFDPFMAMKSTLESSDMAPATLDLDSMTEQPAAQSEQSVVQPEQTVTPVVQQETQPTIQPVVQTAEPTASSDVPTLDLNAIPSQTPVVNNVNVTSANTNPTNGNPLTANIMQNLGGIKLDEKKKKIITIAASCFGVIVLFAIVFIRYPDMFAGGSSEEHGSYEPTQTTSWQQGGTTTTQQPENPQPENPGTSEDPSVPEIEDPTTVTPEEEVVIKQREPVQVEGEDFFNDDNIPTVELDEVSFNASTSGSISPLEEVEGLIGPVSGGDTIVQEATEYVKKGKELKDMGAGQNNRNKMRYGIFIEGKAQETLDALEKGENIDISTWISLKAQFDDYLQKATDA